LATTLAGESLKITQETEYPWDGRVRITMDECPNDEFTLKLRIPGWAEAASVRVNDSQLDANTSPASYAEIRRRWQPGDVVALDLPMPAQLIEAHPLVEEARNQVAVKRGPIVYCLESPDLPPGVRVEHVVVPADVKLTPRYIAGALEGVSVIEGNVLARSSHDWDGALYQPLRRGNEKEISVRFVPYYAWSNRGPSEMTVWLPVK
jgi:uncharacterized protein